MSADGKSALPGRPHLERLGNDADKARMMQLRREADAILVGANTIRRDNVALSVSQEARRYERGLVYPLRITVIGKNPPAKESRIFHPQLGGTTIIACGEACGENLKVSFPGIDLIVCGKSHNINPLSLVKQLEAKFGVKRLLIEGGPTINGIFLEVDLIDRYYVTICPYLLGGRMKEVLTPVIGEGMKNKEDRRFALAEVERAGDWLFLTYDRMR